MARGISVDQSGPYPKRRHVDSLVSQTTVANLTAAVDALDEATLRKVVWDITTTNLSTAHFIFDALEEQKRVAASRIIEFDQQVRSVVHTLKEKNAIYRGFCSRFPGEEAAPYMEEICQLSRDAVDVLRATIDSIAASTTLESHIDTKKGALDALWKIGRVLSTASNFIGSGVARTIGRGDEFEAAVRHVVHCMSYSEIMQVASANSGEVFAKFDELVRLSNRERIFEELPDALVLLFQYKPATYSHYYGPPSEDLEVDYKEADDSSSDWDSDD